MNKSTLWMIKYMNRSVFSKARYMNGVGFEILARTPVPQLPTLPRPPTPLLEHSDTHVHPGIADHDMVLVNVTLNLKTSL